MSSQPLKIATQSLSAQNENILDEAVARLVMSLDGQIVFSNYACDLLAGQMMKGQNIMNAVSFEEPDEAFRQSAMLFAQEGQILTALRSGTHDVRFVRTGESAALQFDHVRAKDGSQYIVASALADDEGFSQTVEKLINRRQSPQEKLLNEFFDLSSDPMCVCGADGMFDLVNERFTELLGFAADDLAGRNFIDLVHPDDKDMVHTALTALMERSGDAVAEFQCRLISNEARSLWMEWKHKKSDRIVYSVGRDMTAIKRHENALVKREQQLSEAEAIGHMGHWHWALGQQEIRFSDEVYRIFGVNKDEFTATLDSVNAMLHRRDVGRLIQAFQRAIIEQNDHEIDFRVIAPSGEIRHVRCQGRCEFDSDGDVIGLFGIMQDVTQTMAHERALREAKDVAERAYAAKSQFLANMSHELRTPLNAIIGFSEMMQQQLLGPIGNDRYIDYIKGIRESGEHLLDLITDILDMSKIEAGKYELSLEKVNVTKVVGLAIHMVESRANENGIRITTNMPEEPVHIVADRRAVMQMVLNLLSNAVKFSRAKGHVEVECRAGKDYLSLCVADHGIGIPANKLKTIMNPFEQVSNQYTRSHEGSGLGLSITKELAELHGGTVHLESVVDVGTSVTIRLPVDATATRRDTQNQSL